MIKKTLFFLTLLLSGGFLCATERVEHQEYKTIGTIYPRYRTQLGSQVSGLVEEVAVDVGDTVHKGDLLIQLDQTLFSLAVAEARTLCDLARVEWDDAEKDFVRMKKLFEKPDGEVPSISQKRFEDAQSRALKASLSFHKAEEVLQRAQRNQEDSKIRAPFDGVVTKRFVHLGDSVTVTPVTKLIEVLSTKLPYVEFSVPQRYLSNIQLRTPIALKIEGIEVEELTALVDRIFPDIDEKTRAFKCRATLPDSLGVYSGALAEISIRLEG